MVISCIGYEQHGYKVLTPNLVGYLIATGAPPSKS
jgi:hypothetical protein